MSERDLGRFLEEWPHQPGRINARLISGADGGRKIQVRLDLGVLQMELDGRPDGRRPEGCDSLLDHQLQRRGRYERQAEAASGFVLSGEECRALREEVVQRYHRYVALFALGDFARVVRDTSHNLKIFDLCRDYAAEEVDRRVLEQFRPHVLMMRTRAAAELALEAKQPKEALAEIDRGLAELRTFFVEAGQEDAYERSNDVQLLRGMRDALVPKLPASQRVELEERLRGAIDAENYELAAILRDELRMMEE
ncbi:MAG: UvrB/UvrC motif-containing protein [Planctomycetota bacterium]|nr:UvrB/UvrC motif-containing protein [Planctomycetota bacterium]